MGALARVDVVPLVAISDALPVVTQAVGTYSLRWVHLFAGGRNRALKFVASVNFLILSVVAARSPLLLKCSVIN